MFGYFRYSEVNRRGFFSLRSLDSLKYTLCYTHAICGADRMQCLFHCPCARSRTPELNVYRNFSTSKQAVRTRREIKNERHTAPQIPSVHLVFRNVATSKQKLPIIRFIISLHRSNHGLSRTWVTHAVVLFFLKPPRNTRGRKRRKERQKRREKREQRNFSTPPTGRRKVQQTSGQRKKARGRFPFQNGELSFQKFPPKMRGKSGELELKLSTGRAPHPLKKEREMVAKRKKKRNTETTANKGKTGA